LSLRSAAMAFPFGGPDGVPRRRIGMAITLP
jgi:hypothetical protein